MSFLEDDFLDTFSKRGWKGVLDGIFEKSCKSVSYYRIDLFSGIYQEEQL